MAGRVEVATVPADVRVLQVVRVVEGDDRRAGERGRGDAGSAAVPVSSSVVSASSSSTCRAVRTRAAPAGVGRTGRLRTSSTCPVADSRARSRWLTADGVTCSTRAAASRLP